MKKIFSVLFILFCVTGSVVSQSKPELVFRSPIDSALSLSANYGQVRLNHFHFGFDIRTGGEGAPIRAAADGYVSRVKAGPYGYGKVVYITHYNELTTIYGHLSAFAGKVAQAVRDTQEARKFYEVEFFPDSGQIKVKKGDVIAYSGNTGFSMAPHLHFEVRRTSNDKTLNPIIFGLEVRDTVKPSFKTLAIYPVDSSSSVNGKPKRRLYALAGKHGRYHFLKPEEIIVSGKIGFGLECYDTENDHRSRNSVYSTELFVDGKKIFACRYDSMSFEEARFINAHIDFKDFLKTGREVQKCFLAKNNKAPVYHEIVDHGIVLFNDTFRHKVRIVLQDFFGNASEFEFRVRSKSGYEEPPQEIPTGKHINCDSAFTFENSEVKLVFPPGCFYQDADFSYSLATPSPGWPAYSILNPYVPVQLSYTIIVKAKLPEKLQGKAVLIHYDDHKGVHNEGGEYYDGQLVAKSKVLGDFRIAIDTTRPFLALHNVKKGRLISSKAIEIRASDNLTGIKEYKAEIDGKWFLMEYEPKKSLMSIPLHASFPKGKHHLEITATDSKGNTSVLHADFNK